MLFRLIIAVTGKENGLVVISKKLAPLNRPFSAESPDNLPRVQLPHLQQPFQAASGHQPSAWGQAAIGQIVFPGVAKELVGPLSTSGVQYEGRCC